MAIFLYGKCWRGRTDCEAIQCIDSIPESTTQKQVQDFDYKPNSFVCCGIAESPEIQQDQYRFCFKNETTDEMSDNDLQDLTSIVVVVGAALNLDAVRKVNSGVVEIPAAQATKEANHYHQIIMSVEKKHEGETRHDTAMRYIKEAEESSDITASSS